MNRSDILAMISRCLGEVLSTDPPEVTDTTRLTEEAGLDSLSSLELLMAIEVAAGISFDPETLHADRFPTVGALADFVAAAQPVAV